MLPVLTAVAVAGPLPGLADPLPGSIRFTGRNLLFTADGEFHRWRIRAANIDEEAPARSRVEVEIDLASLDTGNEQRDEHLRGPEFFDVERHPTAAATVDGFRLIDPDQVDARVTLDLRGVTRTFPIRFRIVDRAARRVAAQVALRRSDFGVGAAGSWFNPLSIDDEVEVRIEVTVPPATDAAGRSG
jgi:polyisoprenoid-binding protein YceI